MRALRWLVLFASGAAALAASSCVDPVHLDAVEALGPEAAGVDEGPTHRPGQPCTVCHNSSGPGEPNFVAAGTVYDRRGSSTAVPGVIVRLSDIKGARYEAVTNDVGNFYVPENDFTPTYPMFVELERDGVTKKMVTRIGRDGGCAVCHRGGGDTRHMPAVYLKELLDP